MVDDNFGFCPHCGAKIPVNADYCTECGEKIEIDEVFNNGPSQSKAIRNKDYMLWATILVGLFAVISIIGALTSIFGADSTIAMLKSMLGDQWAQFLADMGYSSEAQFRDYMVNSGYVSLVSGVLALVSLIACVMRKYWQVAVGACAASAVSLFASLIIVPSSMIASTAIQCVFQCVIGLLVAYLIYMSASVFKQ